MEKVSSSTKRWIVAAIVGLIIGLGIGFGYFKTIPGTDVPVDSLLNKVDSVKVNKYVDTMKVDSTAKKTTIIFTDSLKKDTVR